MEPMGSQLKSHADADYLSVKPRQRPAVFRECLCAVLICSLVMSGCTSVSSRYHRADGETAHLKVACYWRDVSGDRHFIDGLAVSVMPAGSSCEGFPEAVTDYHQPLFFEDLPPGRYRLVITEGEKDYIHEDITLRPGRVLSVRVRAHGRATKRFAIDVAEGVGKAFVVVAGVALLVGILYLELEEEDDDDDGSNIIINIGAAGPAQCPLS